MKVYLLGVLAVVLLGCAPTPGMHFSVIIDKTFSDSDIELAQEALTAWETATQNQLSFYTSIGECDTVGDNQICIHHVSDMEALAAGAEPNWIGFTHWNGNSADIYMPSQLDANLDPAQLLNTFTHEIGHCLQLQHLTEHSAVMYPSLQSHTNTISCYDLSQFYAIRGMTHWAFTNKQCPSGADYVISEAL
jgi:hypothetical protein